MSEVWEERENRRRREWYNGLWKVRESTCTMCRAETIVMEYNNYTPLCLCEDCLNYISTKLNHAIKNKRDIDRYIERLKESSKEKVKESD
jgi:hypothetical protein